MDGQTDVGHINLIGGLFTRNLPKNEYQRDDLTCNLDHPLYMEKITILSIFGTWVTSLYLVCLKFPFFFQLA